MNPQLVLTAIVRRSTARRSVLRVATIAVVLFAFVLLLGGCGEDVREEAVDSSATAASGLPKLVDVGSTSCVPCKMMVPELEALSEEYAGSVDVVFVDVNKDKSQARELKVRLIPTQIFMDPQGNELFRHEGFLSKEDMLSRFQSLGYPLAAATSSSGQNTGAGE
jgi:thioredoxin 1